MANSLTVHTPLVTPMDEDRHVDEESLRALVQYLVSAGIDGLVPCGTTGEFASLTEEERRRVVEVTVEATPDEMCVIAGVGGNAVADVRRRIDNAADAGADAALVVVPYFGGDRSDSGNVAFFEAVVEDSPLPVYLYDIPTAVGQDLSVDAVVSLASNENVVGLKDSSGEITDIDAAIRRTPAEFTVYQGWDAALVPALVMGADGGINAVTQMYPDAFIEVLEAVQKGDLDRARAIQLETIDPAVEALAKHGYAAVVKAVLEQNGVIETAVIRPPQEPLSAGERRAVLESLE